jgi:D-arabinose 1-dehydrogenase-like Zn-dependent alcohol dehydrogenase
MLKTVTAAKLKPVVDSVHPLHDIQKAMGRMEKGEQFGKIVLKVS